MTTPFRPPGLCCFITSDDRPFIFCDRPALPRRSWCQEHYDRCFITVASLYRAKLAREAAVVERVAEAA